ncbi:MAG: PD-(D/E)XK nuclease family protein [Pseudomonadales bacterium]|nr:PD-(D/E)XK nuclease family protein [Pseudomonadales bacterium]
MSSYRIRASSWGSIFDCAYKWEWETLLGNNSVSGPRALLGSAIHASTAVYDQSLLDNSEITIDEAANAFVYALHHPEYDVNWKGGDLRVGEAERIGLTLHSKYCTDVSPYYNYVSVEMETNPLEIDCGDGITIILTGTLDRARIWHSAEGIGISDLKTGVAAVQKGVAKTKGFIAQLGTYELLYEHSTDKEITAPSEIIGLKTSGKAEIGTASVHNAKQMLIGTVDSYGLIDYAKEYFKSGMFPPNPQSYLCSPKYCARWDHCNFHI